MDREWTYADAITKDLKITNPDGTKSPINEKIRPWARGLCVMRVKTIGRGQGGHPWWAQPLFVMIK